MRSSSTIVILVGLWLLACGAARAGAAELIDLVRTLNSLQGELVQGAGSARGAIGAQIEQIEQAFSTLEVDAWKEQKNARATAIFLLCGGSSRAIRKVADAHLFSERDVPLVSGSIAYAEGHSQEALKLLSSMDPKTQPITLGGHLALIQGGLLIGADNARARALFDLARLLMPSSLVEEAALRREISIVDALHDSDKFLLLARRYVAQYSKSPFARNFWDEIRATTLRVSAAVEERRLDEFQSLFKETAPSIRFDIYMAVARKAILSARIALAAAQAQRAEPFAETQAARARLRLYHGAIAALSGDFEAAMAKIREIDAKSFSSADIEMRDIVTAAVARLQAAPDGAAAPETEPETLPQAVSPVERSARQALADADALLQRAAKQ